MPYTDALLTVAGLMLLACISPGANFLVVTSQAMTISRHAGLMAAMGVAAASFTWATLAAFGLAILLQHAPWALTGFRIAGSLYLMYLAYKMIVNARQSMRQASGASVSAWAGLQRGYLTSMTNPKPPAFFASLFLVTLPTDAPAELLIAVVALVSAISVLWHGALALFFSLGSVQDGYRKIKPLVDWTMGGLLALLGLRLLIAQ